MTALSFDNGSSLRSDARREKLRLFSLTVPSLALAAVILFLPIGWLVWQSVVDENGALTLKYYDQIVEQGAYLAILATTFKISFLATLICAALAYPLAYMLTQTSQRIANIAMIGVLAPFWTSVLVRTYAWVILLERRGPINRSLQSLGIIDQPLQLAHNLSGTVIGMVHIMLPYMVLPLYSSMRTIDPSYLRAAANLGASPSQMFRQIFLPLSLPGFFAGLLLVFILCLGFYVTPAMLGGGRVIMIAQRISDSVTLYPTWGPASALGVVLLAITLVILAVVMRLLSRRQPQAQAVAVPRE